MYKHAAAKNDFSPSLSENRVNNPENEGLFQEIIVPLQIGIESSKTK